MAEMANIPLADAGDLVEVLGTVLFFVVIAIVTMIQKAKQRQAEQERLRRKKQQQADAAAKPAQPVSRPTPPRTQTPQRTSHPVAEQLARAARRNLSLPDAPPPPVDKPTVQPKLVELKPVERPLPSEGPVRQRRPAPPKPPQRKPQQPTVARRSGLRVKKQPTIGRTVTKEIQPVRRAVSPPPGDLLDLSDIDEARRAMIHYEIFSQPKALRADREMWQM